MKSLMSVSEHVEVANLTFCDVNLTRKLVASFDFLSRI